jgi:hypothetical protein
MSDVPAQRRLLNRHAEVNEEVAEEIAGLLARIR